MTAGDIYSMLVFQGHMTPGYVMDEMEMYEVDCLMSHLYLASKDAWEQARLVSYIGAQTHSTKKMSVSDIVSFPWEDKTERHDTSMSDADKKRLEMKAKQLEIQMNNER